MSPDAKEITPKSPNRHGNQRGTVLERTAEAAISAEVAAFKSRLHGVHPIFVRTQVRGATALLTFLARESKDVHDIAAVDFAAFRGELEEAVTPSVAKALLGGARAYLRGKAALIKDAALLRLIDPHSVTRAEAAEGEQAAVLREVERFVERWCASGLGRDKAFVYRKGVVALLLFLRARGRELCDVTLEDWRVFHDEVMARGPAAIGECSPSGLLHLLKGARAYLRQKAAAGEISIDRVPVAITPDRPTDDATAAKVGLRARLRYTRHDARGPTAERDFIRFIEEREKSLGTLTPDDVVDFFASVEEKHRAGELPRNARDTYRQTVRAWLREKAREGAIDEERFFDVLYPHALPEVKRCAAGGDARALIDREIVGFCADLEARGFRKGGQTHAYARSALRMLLFLRRIATRLVDVSLDTWARFRDEISAAMPADGAHRTLKGARAYLRMKHRQGILRSDQVPPRIQRHADESRPADVRREVGEFRSALRAAGHTGSTVSVYGIAARELLLFLHRDDKAASTMTADDFERFAGVLKTLVDEGRMKPQRFADTMGALRFFLRFKAAQGEIRDERLRGLMERPKPAPKAKEYPDEEVSEYQRLGVRADVSHAVLTLLRFLERRGKKLQAIEPGDWNSFRRLHAGDSVIVARARDWLQQKVRSGRIRRDQLRTAETPAPIVLPPGLQAGRELIDEAMNAHDLARKTRPTYRRAVRDLMVWLADQGIAALADVSRDLMTSYRLHLKAMDSRRGMPYAVRTQISHLVALRFFFGYLVRTGKLLADPMLHIVTPRPPQRIPRTLKVREVSQLLRKLPKTSIGIRDRAMLEVFYGTGIRRAELTNLRIDDLDLEGRTILIRAGKGQKDRLVPVGQKAKEALLDYLELARPKLLRGEDRGMLFVARHGHDISEGWIGARVEILGHRVGLHVRPHLLRHTCATHLLKGRADIRHIQRLLGHESLSTTERYTKVEIADLRKVIERCHPREKGQA